MYIAGPLVLETLFKHFLNPGANAKRHNQAREDDLMYDEGTYYIRKGSQS